MAQFKPSWLLYGATGYTGALIAEMAKARGAEPILAGRNADKLKILAEKLGPLHRPRLETACIIWTSLAKFTQYGRYNV